MKKGLEELKNIDPQVIAARVHIVQTTIEDMLNKRFEKINPVKAKGLVKILEQELMKEIKHIQQLFRKEVMGEISIDTLAKNELVEIETTLQNRLEELKRSSSNACIVGDFTLEEIAKTMGITRERVRQIETSAIKKIKNPKIGRKLKTYLEI